MLNPVHNQFFLKRKKRRKKVDKTKKDPNFYKKIITFYNFPKMLISRSLSNRQSNDTSMNNILSDRAVK